MLVVSRFHLEWILLPINILMGKTGPSFETSAHVYFCFSDSSVK